VCEVFVGIPFPPGLQLGSTQTGFHPLIDSLTLSLVIPLSSNGTWAIANAEKSKPTQNPERTLCTIFIIVSEYAVNLSGNDLVQDAGLRTVPPESFSRPRMNPTSIKELTCRYQKYITNVLAGGDFCGRLRMMQVSAATARPTAVAQVAPALTCPICRSRILTP
jgi:hypothetical protein